jgi:RNA polymerase sigma-70 factor (ECF subfamily)
MGAAISGDTDVDLCLLLQDGDPRALDTLYARYGGLAYSLAIRVLADQGRAEEVVQDVFLTVWRRHTSFDPARGSFRTWFLALVRNRAIDALRNRASRGFAAELPPDLRDASTRADPWEVVSVGLERQAVREALASLPGEQRQVIELAYFGGQTHSEISETLGLPLGTVKGRIRLGLEKLHSRLSAEGMTRT